MRHCRSVNPSQNPQWCWTIGGQCKCVLGVLSLLLCTDKHKIETIQPSEKAVISQLEKQNNGAEELALYTKCSGIPCILNVDAPVDGATELSESTISLNLKAGIPNVISSSDADYPFSKQIAITAEGAIPHTMTVVVTGGLSAQCAWSIPVLSQYNLVYFCLGHRR